jgi:DNA-binding beta-propeller fold protein YncE
MKAFSFLLQHRLIPFAQAVSCTEGADMHNSSIRRTFFAGSILIIGASTLFSQNAPSVKLIQSVDLPGYSGDFDHFAVDFDRNRLLLAAEDHGTVEVFDLRTSAHLRTVDGFGNPHSILVRKGSPTILVTDSEKQGATLRDANTYAQTQSVPLTPGSDTSKYDAAANVLYVVTGGKDVDMKTANLEAVNPDTGEKLRSITFQDNHVEAMAFVDYDPRLFINLAQTNKIAVVDRRTMKLLATWPVTPAKQNAMVAFDPDQHRLYVVCRDPGMVVVMNSDTGAVIDTQPAPLRSDEVQYDRYKQRLYVPGGEGYMAIYDTRDADHLKLIEKVSTAPGAKTGLLVTARHRLYLAVSPGDTKATAKVLTYEVE